MPKAKLRFRLHHLFGLVAIVACFAWWIRSVALQAEFEKRTVQAIILAQRDNTNGPRFRGSPSQVSDNSILAETDNGLLVMQRNLLGQWALPIFPIFNRVTAIYVEDLKFGDSELCLVAQFPELRHLVAAGTEISDRGVAELSRCRHLLVLDVGETRITDTGANAIGRLHNLEVLGMYSTKISDKGVQSLSQLRHLQVVNLRENRITDRAIPTLCQFEKLIELDVRWTDISEEGYDQLERNLADGCVLLGD